MFKIRKLLISSFLPQNYPKIKSFSVVFFVFFFSFFITIPAYSVDFQAAVQRFNPESVEPGVIGKTISNQPEAFAPRPAPGVAFQKPAASPTSPEGSKISFVLTQVIIEGNCVYSTDTLQAIFAPYINHTITVTQLQSLVQKVTDKYQNAGYFLSKALLPPQEIKGGIVKVKVIEGFISHIKVQGVKNKPLIRFLNHYGADIIAIKPIRLAELERILLLINDVPGVTVKSVLAPDPSVPLGSTLTLLATHTPLQVTAIQNN